jgi:hypothetical protein
MRDYPGLENRVIRPIYLAQIDFPSGTIRLNSSDRDFTVGADVFKGVGRLGSISPGETTTGTQATSIRLTLLGLPNDLVMQIGAEDTRNKLVQCWFMLLGDDYQPIAAPILWFRGRSDSCTINVGRATTVSISASSRLINWARSVNSRYTHEDQWSKYPGDKGLMFVSRLADTKLFWGAQ